jgi:Inner membrane component of T3SS, cytoplasmic domain
MAFTLVITTGNETGREIVFGHHEVVLGRTRACDVVLDEPGVSERHARIFARGSAFFVEDLGAWNGTKVNGASISEHELRAGDAITIGSVRFKFKPDQPELTSPELSAANKSAAPGTQPGPRPTAEKRRPSALSAAQRSRLKRQGRIGKAKLWWLDARTSVKAALAFGVSMMVLVPICGLGYSLLREPAPQPAEPMVLGSEPIRASFGVGKDVSFERTDEKVFYFQVNSPAGVVAVLHYQSKDIGSADEVSINVNGTEIGWLTPDTLNSDDRGYELLVPTALIKPNELNLITFNNLKNAHDADPWRIWNVWLESDALPDKSDAWLISDAEEKLRLGLKKWSQRDIGAPNRWQAYRHFREAWLTVEAIPSAKRRPVYLLARERMLAARTELDLKCRNLLVEAQRAYSQNERAQTIAAFKQVEQYFPSRSHPCQDRAEYDRDQLGL